MRWGLWLAAFLVGIVPILLALAVKALALAIVAVDALRYLVDVLAARA